jgi:phosphatidate cytidylyltransferase
MNKVIQRLLVFFIGIPAVVALVLFLPYKNNLILNIVIVIFCSLGAVEFSSMLKAKQLVISKAEAAILGALVPCALTLTICFSRLPDWITIMLLMAGAGYVLFSRAFYSAEKLDNVINNIAAGFAVIIYPGFFMYWIIKMTSWGNPALILIFLLINFANDSTAWLTGTLFGKNNRGIIPASPNKSVAGYIGGTAGAIIVAVGAALIAPAAYPVPLETTPINTLVIQAVILAFFTSIAGSLGDLAESAIKRSCNFKDSGKLMLGRGGILDSIDSISCAAPVFFLLCHLLFFNS